jgi:iron complex transport system permease protein
MHIERGHDPVAYRIYLGRKKTFLFLGGAGLLALFLVSLSLGPVSLPISHVIRTLMGQEVSKQASLIIWNIRLPQALAAVAAGVGLAVSGGVMQSLLRNPLGSPFTLGISQAAAFGAAFSVLILGTGGMQSTLADAVTITDLPLTVIFAFGASMIATFVILALSGRRNISPESIVLSGVAVGSLFTAGTLILQFFADDTELAAMVFWTFGDLARAGWSQVIFLSCAALFSMAFFLWRSWDYNAIDSGEETAFSLGVRVKYVRLFGMFIASLITALIVSCVGVIGFVGLVAPHMVRRLLGDDHRFLIPGSAIAGALLLLGADLAARTIISPRILPVSVLTSFLGAPLFIYLIIRGSR